ncbi:alpha/beta hydrolase fold domain-containing protein [Corynebacterium lizhenjunii]|uniref:Alpha/beta hydrolase fold domain-containing protein n=1 Tax=Corynebacterium lizhenjunii TaxID=2709394 RepID=A0A7T0KGC4_9CORY|nr:alpha/beta hydrolase fold domain-containing protein [Corynebacterium lizhenjunii]QPK79248.1 alpha/beta hydrolase fold domain-containing protein [Corynebacterium lizhenjunii]
MSTQDNAAPLEPGQEWYIGGHDRQLSEDAQLDQLTSYLDAHYELPDFRPPWAGGGTPAADVYCAHLPDRITHAAMLVLGSGVDHAMPGTAYLGGVEVHESAHGAVFVPSQPTGRYAVSLHSGGWWRGSGQALEMQWRPEVAAAAELSGTTIVDVDYPLAPQHTVADMVAAVQAAIDAQPGPVAVWGYSSGAALAALLSADASILTFPDFRALAALPEELRAGYSLDGVRLPNCLIQTATRDEVAAPVDLPGAQHARYVSTHRVSTPAVARQRIRDTAEFLRDWS